MSTQERTQDPGEHGYGAAKQEPDSPPDAESDREQDDRREPEANPSRRDRDDDLRQSASH